MSWDASLECGTCGHEIRQWNYTHNCNRMANRVLTDIAHPGDETWWKLLNGMSGPDGAAFLAKIIAGLEADPETFRAQNPENGWGSYDSFVKVLSEMRDAVPEARSTWRVWG